MREREELDPGEVEPSHMLTDPVMEPGRRGDRNRRLAAALVALLLTGVLAGILWPFVRSPRTTKDRRPDPVGEITELAIEGGSIWALSCNSDCSRDRGRSSGRAIKIDPSSGKMLASAAIEDPSSLAVGEGGVWVTNFRTNTLSRIDPKTAEVVATIQLRLPFAVCATCPDPYDFLPFDVAAGEGAVWVSTGRGAVARIDPATNAVEMVITLPGGTGGEVAAGEGAVWVADNVAGVHRIDPSSNRLAATITVEGEGDRRLSVDQVQVGGGSVWALGTWARRELEAGGHQAFVSATGTALARINPTSGDVVWVRPVVPDPPRLTVDAGSLWLIHGPTAAHIDPGTGKVDRILEARAGERYVAVGAGASWVVSSEGELSRWEAPLNCPPVQEGFGPPALSPVSGPAGTTVTISGRLGLYDKDGIVYRPTERVEIWWNLDLEGWWTAEAGQPAPAGPGPVALLTHDLPVGKCTFEGTFRAPNVAAGSYGLVAVHFGGSGSTAHGFASFTVTVPGPKSPVAQAVNGGTLDMTFPDGTTARIAMPAGQDLRSFPLQPDVTLVWPGHYVAPIVFSRGGPYEAILAGTEPEERLSSGETVWRSKSVSSWPNLHETTRWVIFSLPDWSVHVPVPPDIHPDEIVDAVDPEQSPDGLVVVRVRAPVVLADSFGEGGGPQVAIGDRDPLPDVVDAGPQFRVIELAPDECTGGRHLETDIGGPDELYASLCLAEGELFASVYGDADFVRDVYEGLDVVSFTSASNN